MPVGEQDSELTPDAESGVLIGSTLGGFRLTSLLGVGGMAEVYRGYDLQLQRDVAVKVLPDHVARDPRYVSRFRSEAQRVAALHHPNVVPIFHFGEERGLLYLVMPILKESLRDRISREGTLDPAEAIILTVEVALALDAAHSQGIVHRDVKPENILLDDEGKPLLSDFGIAREVEVLRDPTASRTLATTGMPVGTPSYMPPELLRGATADHRVDVYGLGTVLYEMLVGRPPHEGITAFDVAARVLTEAPVPPANYNPAVWPALEEVVLVAIASDPDQRYPDTSSLVEALRLAMLARGTSTGVSSMAALPARVPTSTRPAETGVPRHTDTVPAGGPAGATWPDPRDPSMVTATHWDKPGRRRRALLAVAATVVLVLAFAASGVGGVLFALHSLAPTTTSYGSATGATTAMPTTGPGATTATAMPTTGRRPSPTAGVANSPTVAQNPTLTPIPSATATPLLTPTMVVSANPLNFQSYPASAPTSCRATQTLTNISAVPATWSWKSTVTPSGWNYNYTGFGNPMSGWKNPLSLTTQPNQSVSVYIQTTDYATNCKSKPPFVATISVTNGNGAQFNVTYPT